MTSTTGLCGDTPYLCERVTRDAAGTTYLTETDSGCDGRTNWCELRFILDESGEHQMIGSDQDCDGVPDGPCHLELLAANGVRTNGLDYDCDGDLDKIGETVCEERVLDGPVAITFLDYDCDGVPEHCVRERYDARGNLVAREGDTGCDGIADDSCETMRYSPDGQLEESMQDAGCDGSNLACTVRVP